MFFCLIISETEKMQVTCTAGTVWAHRSTLLIIVISLHSLTFTLARMRVHFYV
jgi:hypothetical protein